MKKKIIFIGMILSLLSSAATSMAVDIDTDTRNVIISGKAAAKQSTATIIIKNKTNGDIAYIAEANVIDGRYYTKFKLPIDNPSDYTVSINSGGEDITKDILSAVYHSSKFENVLSFSGTNANKYFTDGDFIGIQAKIKNLYADETEYKIYFACYDDSGRLIGAVGGEKNKIGYGGDGEEYVSDLLSTSVPNGTSMIKAFAWTDTIQPIDTVKEQKNGDKSYQDGDTVSFMGDSITHIGIYPYFIEHYYQTRYPNREIAFYNKGISGQSASGVFKRLDWDIFAEGTNRTTLMIGVNDITPYFQENSTAEQGEQGIQYCIDNYKKVIERCKENDVEITLVTPPLADLKDSADSANTYEKLNNGLKALSLRIKELAAQEGISVYDINTMTNDITNYGNSIGEKNVIQGGDGIHPTNTGYTILGYCYLKEQGADSVVASAEISKENTVETNCGIYDLNYSDNNVSFVYSPKSSPLAANTNYMNAQKFVPSLTDDLNREIIKVSDLEDGTYTLKFGDETVGEYTSAELANGINIALLQKNPNQKRSASAYEKLMLKDKEVDKLRAIALTTAIGGDRIKTDSGYREFLNDYKNHPYIESFKRYSEYKPKENEIKEAAEKYSKEAAELSKPILYQVSLIKK